MKKQKQLPRNTFFNFRLNPVEMQLLKQISKDLGYLSFAEFIRTAIREKIKREKG
jgi:hypothetical protein